MDVLVGSERKRVRDDDVVFENIWKPRKNWECTRELNERERGRFKLHVRGMREKEKERESVYMYVCMYVSKYLYMYVCMYVWNVCKR